MYIIDMAYDSTILDVFAMLKKYLPVLRVPLIVNKNATV